MGSSTVFCLIACLYGVDAKKEDIDSLQVLQNRAAQIVTRDYLQEQKEKDVSAN